MNIIIATAILFALSGPVSLHAQLLDCIEYSGTFSREADIPVPFSPGLMTGSGSVIFNSDNNVLNRIDLTDPLIPTVTSSITLDGIVSDIVAVDDYIYCVVNDSTIAIVRSTTSGLTLISEYHPRVEIIAIDGEESAIVVAGKWMNPDSASYLHGAIMLNRDLVSGTLDEASTFLTDYPPTDIAIEGNRCYVASGLIGYFKILDISDIHSPAPLAVFTCIPNARCACGAIAIEKIAVKGNSLFILGGTAHPTSENCGFLRYAFVLMDIEYPESPIVSSIGYLGELDGSIYMDNDIIAYNSASHVHVYSANDHRLIGRERDESQIIWRVGDRILTFGQSGEMTAYSDLSPMSQNIRIRLSRASSAGTPYYFSSSPWYGETSTLYDCNDPTAPIELYEGGRRGFREISPGRFSWYQIFEYGALRGLLDISTHPIQWWRGETNQGSIASAQYFWVYGPGDTFTLFNVADLSSVVEVQPHPDLLVPRVILGNIALQNNNTEWTVIDLLPIEGPKPRGTFTLPVLEGNNYDFVVSTQDGMIFIILPAPNTRLWGLDISDPDYPLLHDIAPIEENSHGIASTDSAIFIASDSGILCFTTSNHYGEVLATGSYESGEPCYDITIKQNILYALFDRTLKVFDISDPIQPVLLGQSESSGRHLYVGEDRLTDGGSIYPLQCETVGIGGNHDQESNQPELSVPILVHPNPFNPSTEISFELERPGMIHLAVYDLNGRCLRRLKDAYSTSGTHSISWDGQTDEGQHVSAGVYVIRLQTEERVITRKVALLK